jgi:hypothetical protein
VTGALIPVVLDLIERGFLVPAELGPADFEPADLVSTDLELPAGGAR